MAPLGVLGPFILRDRVFAAASIAKSGDETETDDLRGEQHRKQVGGGGETLCETNIPIMNPFLVIAGDVMSEEETAY